MSDPLKIEQPSGFRNAVYGMMGALIVQGIGVVWWVSQTEARFDARLTAIEAQQTLSRALEDKLNGAREDATVHFAHIDDQLTDVSGKLSAILESIQQQEVPPNTGPQNFQHAPGGRP